MAVQPEGTPCWADAMFGDVEGAKSFYGDVLGWTFGESSTEYGNYTQAYSDGKAVAAVVPPMPGQEGQSAWCLYFASPDVAATAGKIRDNGGEVLMEPMQVGDFGSMLLARDPGGVVFGVWQAGVHEGFEKTGEPGAYCWAEVFTRDPAKADAFFPAVFPYRAQQLEDEAIDFRIFNLGDETVLGRMKMTDEFPPEVAPYLNVYFSVDDCDAAVTRATERGGVLRLGP
ncbi:MAG: VOC family protein, partial [Actinomycetota bacterium]